MGAAARERSRERPCPEPLEATTESAASNFIGGEWVASASGRTYEKPNPARPSESVGPFPLSGEEDVNAAVEAAAAPSRLAACRRPRAGPS